MEQTKKPWEMTAAELATKQPVTPPVAIPDEAPAIIRKTDANGRTYTKNAFGQFIKGPGRPKGSKNRVTLAIESLMEGEAERISRRCIDLALSGDTTAMRLVLDRIAPVRKGRPIPKLEKHEKETNIEALLRSVLEGEISPEEGKEVVGLIESAARVAAAEALTQMRSRQLEALKEAAKNAGGLTGGVMLVPLGASLDDWEAFVVPQQYQLKQTVRD